ncbi:sodium/glutamate symporter [Shigella flexneri]
MLAILVVQTIFMALYAIFVTWRMMGKNYDAAVLAAGHCGFGLVQRQRESPTAAITTFWPVAHGVFGGADGRCVVIDIVNALVIKLYLMLPIFAG